MISGAAKCRAGLAVAVLSSVLLSSACGGGEKPKKAPPSAPGGSSSAQRPGTAIAVRTSFFHGSARIELLSLQKMADKVVLARFRIVNGTEATYPIETSLTGNAEVNEITPKSVDPSAASGISLVDGRNARQHFPLNRADGECLCTQYHPFPPSVAPGQSLELAAVFPAPPADVRSLDVLFPHAPPFVDIPLTVVPTQQVTLDPEQQPVDPVAVEKAPPLILPIIGTVEAGANAEDDDGQNLSVRLATDVLFATGKHDLNGAAQNTLRAVAAKIDKSEGSTIKIDGYTDTTGDDAINDPLSARRAEAVKAALAKMVTRSGVSFQAQGHGSAAPVASNETAEGRRKNRRVTVSFARPVDSAPVPQTSATPGGGLMEPFPRPVIGRAPLDPEGGKSFGVSWPKSGDVEINSLHRDAAGYVTLVFTVNNTGKSVDLDPARFSDLNGPYVGASTSGVVLRAGDTRVRLLRNSTKRAVGSPNFNSYGPSDQFYVDPGDSQPFWAMFKAPATLTSVSVEIPGFKTVPNIPIN